MEDLIAALGLMFAIEGALYALFPELMKRMMAQVQTMPEGVLRNFGFGAVALGVLIVWLVRG